MVHRIPLESGRRARRLAMAPATPLRRPYAIADNFLEQFVRDVIRRLPALGDHCFQQRMRPVFQLQAALRASGHVCAGVQIVQILHFGAGLLETGCTQSVGRRVSFRRSIHDATQSSNFIKSIYQTIGLKSLMDAVLHQFPQEPAAWRLAPIPARPAAARRWPQSPLRSPDKRRTAPCWLRNAASARAPRQSPRCRPVP